ncbi:MAG: DUF2461 domain-containing protein [Woeseiaceae bacterium]|nr:DUF2461 domain-containing protein [Woeseiaceae bacterium]
MTRPPFFTRKTLRFLEELERNNDREWFAANKPRYEADVLDPALAFIDAMYEPLGRVAPRFTAIPRRVGGSLMRIYRDTRFSRDKTPYKTNIGIQFRHELGRDVHAPGFYLHIEADSAFIGAGMWRPASDPLRAIRERIAARPKDWLRAVGDKRFRRHFSLRGEALSRPPRGFDKGHPQIEDIKRKDFIAVRDIAVTDVLKPGLSGKVVTSIEAAEPFMRFLCKATGVPY